MKEDRYGAEMERIMRDADEPLTAADLIERVGCSRQRVYTWLKANKVNLVPVDRNRKGATSYTWRDHGGETGGVGAGTQLTVADVTIHNGSVHLELVAPDGSKFDAIPVR